MFQEHVLSSRPAWVGDTRTDSAKQRKDKILAVRNCALSRYSEPQKLHWTCTFQSLFRCFDISKGQRKLWTQNTKRSHNQRHKCSFWKTMQWNVFKLREWGAYSIQLGCSSNISKGMFTEPQISDSVQGILSFLIVGFSTTYHFRWKASLGYQYWWYRNGF